MSQNHPNGPQETPRSVVALIKDDLRKRFEGGHRPSVKEYVDRYPELAESRDGMMSLLYEEYCLREEAGEQIDPEEFCDRYEPWRDSLISQLRYHAAFSRLASVHRPRPRFPEPGEQFLWFHLDSKLGEGGAGRVYLARDQNLGGRKVALKISLDQGNEPSIQGRLDHPNIVPVNLVEREPETGLRGLCMPYSPGLSLDRVIERIYQIPANKRRAIALWDVLVVKEPSPEEEMRITRSPGWVDFPVKGSFEQGAAWLVLKLAEALVHAHNRDVLHRDIKPANVLLTHRNGPMLLDFNLSQTQDTPEEVENAACGGTLPYMAPEQLRAFLDPELWSKLTPTVDIYSLGLVLRELLTGIRPAASKRGMPVARMVNEQLDLRRDATYYSARKTNPRISAGLDAILMKCLALHQEERYAHAHELVEDLRRFLARRPLRFATNPSYRDRAKNALFRHRLPVLASGLLVTTSLVVPPVLHNWSTSQLKQLKVEMHDDLLIEAVQADKDGHFTAEGLVNRAVDLIRSPVADRKRNMALAKEMLDGAIQKEPTHTRALHMRSVIAFDEGDLAGSLNHLLRAEHSVLEGGQEDLSFLGIILFERAGVLWSQGTQHQNVAKLNHVSEGPIDPLVTKEINEARTKYILAYKDILESNKYLPENAKQPPLYDYRIAQILGSLGDLFAMEENYGDAIKNYKSAADHIRRGIKLNPVNSRVISLCESLLNRNERNMALIHSKLVLSE